MRVRLNDQSVEVDAPMTLLEFVQSRTATTRGSAVAVDGVVIPRAEWPTFGIHEGQHLELVTAVQGG